jgi:hypothetical protein
MQAKSFILYCLMSNLEYLEQTKPRYKDLITDFNCQNDCLNYLLRSSEHQSKIASLRFLYINNYGEIVTNFYNELLREKKALESLLKDKS